MTRFDHPDAIPGAAAREAANRAAWAFLRQLGDERAESALAVRLRYDAGGGPAELSAPVFTLVALEPAAAEPVAH